MSESRSCPFIARRAPLDKGWPAPYPGTMTDKTPPGDRIAKVLSRAGVASRREAERMIEAGRVRVNGEIIARAAVLDALVAMFCPRPLEQFRRNDPDGPSPRHCRICVGAGPKADPSREDYSM